MNSPAKYTVIDGPVLDLVPAKMPTEEQAAQIRSNIKAFEDEQKASIAHARGESCRDSSVLEQREASPLVAGSIPAPGSISEAVGSVVHFSGFWQITVIRKELKGSTLFTQSYHAVREAGVQWVHLEIKRTMRGILRECDASFLDLPSPPEDLRNAVFMASKAQLTELVAQLEAADVQHYANREVDGPMAGVLTCVSLITADRRSLDPFIGTPENPRFKMARMWRVDDEEASK